MHTLLYKQFSQKAGIGLAVLLLHVFLWFTLRDSSEIRHSLPGAQSLSMPYLALVPVTKGGESAPASDTAMRHSTHIPRNSLATSPPVTVQRRVIPRAEPLARRPEATAIAIGNNRMQLAPAPERSPPPTESPMQSAEGERSGQGKHLDYDAIKKSARAIAGELAERPMPGAGKSVSEAEKFANAVANAKRGDCRTEKVGLGLIGIPFLLKDTLTGTGCKW